MQGRSYNEISQLLKVPKSTLSSWFTGLELPDEAVERIKKRVGSLSLKKLIARNKNQSVIAEKRSNGLRDEGERMIDSLSRRDLIIIGSTLYWAEGYKRPVIRNGRALTSHRVSLTNSDPNIICIFIKFLTEICEIPCDNIKVWVRYFDHQDPAYILNFWQKTCRIPHSNFKTTLQSVSISSQRKRSYNSLPFGVAQVSVGNTNLYHKIMGMISGISKGI